MVDSNLSESISNPKWVDSNFKWVESSSDEVDSGPGEVDLDLRWVVRDLHGSFLVTGSSIVVGDRGWSTVVVGGGWWWLY